MVASTKAILIAEGDERHRSELRTKLRDQGFQVCEAWDRLEVLRRLRCNGIDLTIIGSSHDGSWDGPDLVKAIRKRDRRLPTILINGHSSEDRAIAALRAGAKDYFKRPYAFVKLITSINRNLAISQARVSVKTPVSSDGALLRSRNDSPLSPVLRELLVTCLALKTTEAKALAAHLNRSPATIRTEFQRILAALGVHTRYAAVKTAEDLGWLQVEGSGAEH